MPKINYNNTLTDEIILYLLEEIHSPALYLTPQYQIIGSNSAAEEFFKNKHTHTLEQKSFSTVCEENNITISLPTDLATKEDHIIIAVKHSLQKAQEEPPYNWTLKKLFDQNQLLHGLILTTDPTLYSKDNYLSIILKKIFPQLNNILTVLEGLYADEDEIEQKLKIKNTLTNMIIPFQKKTDTSPDWMNTTSLHFNEFNLITLIKEMIALVSPDAKRKNLEIGFSYPDATPEYMNGNKDKIYKILISLIAYAIKETVSGHIFVNLSLADFSENQFLIKLDIESGTGKTTEKHIDIDPFCQKNLIESTPDLILINNMIETLHGEMIAEYEPGKNLTFHLTIPAELPPHTTPIKRNEGSLKSDSIKPKILLVEDDEICQHIIKNASEKFNCDIFIANNFQQAIKILHEHSYTIILLDIGLPDKDGITFAKEVRERFKINIPIIVTTAHEWDKRKYDEVGINGVLKKPISIEKLHHLLFQHINNAHFNNLSRNKSQDIG